MLIPINRDTPNQERKKEASRGERGENEWRGYIRPEHTEGVSEILGEGSLRRTLILYRMEYMPSTNSFSAI